jgi:peptidoglycan-associated lipoprotein
LKLEMSAHTDSRGGDSFNQKLSQERAQSVVDFLKSKGIAKNRLVAMGYGEKMLVVSDKEIEKIIDEAGQEKLHQKNRRTEFKIIE